MTQAEHYTFGDNDLAAERLGLLARAFEPSSRAWLTALALPRGRRVVDLGCGAGHTTALLGDCLEPSHLYGLDQSTRLIARAQQSQSAGLARFVAHDVTQGPFPVPPADIAYTRFLLTHLRDPGAALALWAQAAAPSGRLLLEEVADLSCRHPAFTRYYALVQQLQAHYGQVTYIGTELHALVHDTPWAIERERLQRIELPARVMARLHVLNLATWGTDAYAQSAFDSAELAELARVLNAVATGADAPEVTCTMAQLALVKPRGSDPALLPSALSIEDAQADHVRELLALQRSAFSIEAEREDHWALAPLQQTEAELAAEIASGTVLVARHGNALVGSVRAQIEGATCHVGRLMVRPDLQGRGIGRALMAAIEARCAEAQQFELFTSVRASRNLRLYERLGYREVRRGRECGGIDVVFMHRLRQPPR
jgi:ribosomal protein S18 acetylase RimI-like enzyme/SAM-dependent methyltransferase